VNVVNTIQAIAGELYAMPEEILELVKDTPELNNAMREYLKGEKDYADLLNLVSENC
jgi:hypothetical protein